MRTCAREGCDKEARVKYCSDACKTAYWNPLRIRSNPTTKDCPVCQKRFTAQPNRITCSDRCRSKLYQCRKVVRAAEANAAA